MLAWRNLVLPESPLLKSRGDCGVADIAGGAAIEAAEERSRNGQVIAVR